MKNKVLVITGEQDPMWPFLQAACSNEEYSNLILYPTDKPEYAQCEYNPIKGSLHFLIGSDTYTQDQIKGVWWRRTPMPIFNFDSRLNKYCEEEYLMFLDGIENIIPQALWVSKPSAIYKAKNKVLQLILAKELGFSVLDTILTNSPKYGRKFVRSSKTIYKTIKTPRIPLNTEKQTTVFTSIIESNRNLDGLISCPGILQKFTEKIADIRVSVFGDETFSVRIESQQNKSSMVDFRHGARNVDHTIFTLPSSVSNLCKELVKKLDLKYGAIDLALLEDNSFVFFEINPNGQWGWLEERTGLKMRRALLNLLFQY